jgi:serine/threonine-protein phosphatase 6 regulatory subunit 3
MAFWRNFAPSNIEQILEKEEFSLEELLDEEDFVQECKHCCNQSLLDFLATEESISKMVCYMVDAPPPESDQMEYKRRTSACAEVFLCEVAALLKAFTDNAEHLAQFLGYLRQGPSETDPVRDGFFCRVLLTVCRSFPDQVMGASDVAGFIKSVIEHLGNDSFKNDLLVPIMKADSEEGLYSITKWMLEGGVVEGLLEAYSTTEDDMAHRNIAEVLHELAQDSKPCLEILQQKEKMETLLKSFNSPSRGRAANTMHALIGLVFSSQSEEEEEDEFVDPDAKPQETPAFVSVLCESMPSLVSLLIPSTSEEATSISLPVGPVQPPLGRVRLEALHFFALLLRGYKGDEDVQASLVQNNVLTPCVDILFSHPWHNIAHFYVQEVITHCLKSTALQNALVDADLPKRMVDAMEALPPPPEEGTAPDHSYHRPGNIGTIVDLANAMELCSDMQTRLAEDERWCSMKEGSLKEENRKQSLELGSSSLANSGLGDFNLNLNCADSSSSDEERDPDNNSSGSSDEDDDPLRHFSVGSSSANNIGDTFRTNTEFVNDGADAWDSHEITDSSNDSEWVANFEANFATDLAVDPWEHSQVNDAEAMVWKADFEASNSAAFGVEDPFQSQTTDNAPFEANFGSDNPPFEADFSSLSTSPPPEPVEVVFAEAFAGQEDGSHNAKGTAEVVIDEILSEVEHEQHKNDEEPSIDEVPEDQIPEANQEDVGFDEVPEDQIPGTSHEASG